MCEREMATIRINNREERRRKIIARGSDRLALITGKTQNLIPADNHHHHHDSLIQSSPPKFSSDHHLDPQTTLSDHTNTGSDEHSADASCSALPKHETNVDVSRVKTFDDRGKQLESQLHKDHTNKEDMQTSFVDRGTKSEPLLAKSQVQEPSNDTKLLPKTSRTNKLNIFSCKQVNSCIIASQGTRNFFALMIALLVVLSYIDYPLFGRNIVSSKGIVTSRPLYILLLTDVTIVLVQLYLEEQRHSEEAEKEKVISEKDGHDLTETIKLMERGLVAYQCMQAIFIDFSIYVVVVVCALSLM